MILAGGDFLAENQISLNLWFIENIGILLILQISYLVPSGQIEFNPATQSPPPTPHKPLSTVALKLQPHTGHTLNHLQNKVPENRKWRSLRGVSIRLFPTVNEGQLISTTKCSPWHRKCPSVWPSRDLNLSNPSLPGAYGPPSTMSKPPMKPGRQALIFRTGNRRFRRTPVHH